MCLGPRILTSFGGGGGKRGQEAAVLVFTLFSVLVVRGPDRASAEARPSRLDTTLWRGRRGRAAVVVVANFAASSS